MKNQRIAVVTGANRGNGLGFHLVQELRHRGYTVVGTYRNPETSEALMRLAHEDAGVLALPMDVRCHESVRAMAREIRG